MPNNIIIITTTDTQEEAEKLSCLLVEKKIAACVQVSTIKSYYMWQQKFEKSDEYILHIKTDESMYDKIENLILKNHSYDLPEIIAIPICKGYSKYFKWMNENIKTDKKNGDGSY